MLTIDARSGVHTTANIVLATARRSVSETATTKCVTAKGSRNPGPTTCVITMLATVRRTERISENTTLGRAIGAGQSMKQIARSALTTHGSTARSITGGSRARCSRPTGTAAHAAVKATPAFLSIDHVNGGGRAHRKAVGGGIAVLLDIIKRGFPAQFQLLCYNCNLGPYLNGGSCPHKDQDDFPAA